MSRGEAPWLLLVHSVPPKPPYLRAKVMRRLTQLGALPLKRSAYLLPATDSAREDLQWLRQEIAEEGGEAWIVESRFVAGLRDEEVRENFRAMRTADYRGLAAEAQGVVNRMRTVNHGQESPTLDAERRRLVRRLEAVRRIDFFAADGRNEVEALMATIDRLANTTARTPTDPTDRRDLQGRTWVTRAGVKVDRMASAWLIRRFIDAAATFVFVEADDTPRIPASLRFDMFDGEFTHDGSRCTFEVLLDIAGHGAEPAFVAIAQMVHDIDLRDDRYRRSETAGVAAVIEGIALRFDDDHRRVAESAPVFDALYASLGGRAVQAPVLP